MGVPAATGDSDPADGGSGPVDPEDVDRAADDVPRHAALYLTDGFRWLDAARSGLRNHPDLVTLVTPMLLGHEVVLTAIEPMGRSMEEALVVRREQHIPAPPAAVFAL